MYGNHHLYIRMVNNVPDLTTILFFPTHTYTHPLLLIDEDALRWWHGPTGGFQC